MSKGMQKKIQSMFIEPTLTISNLAHINESMGKFFFRKTSMAFFNSRLGDIIYRKGKSNLVYFISSERMNFQSPRRFTIREMNLDSGDVNNIGEFQGYPTSYSAKAVLMRKLIGDN